MGQIQLGEEKASCKQISPMSQQRFANSQQTAESLSHMGSPGVGVCWADNMAVINQPPSAGRALVVLAAL